MPFCFRARLGNESRGTVPPPAEAENVSGTHRTKLHDTHARCIAFLVLLRAHPKRLIKPAFLVVFIVVCGSPKRSSRVGAELTLFEDKLLGVCEG